MPTRDIDRKQWPAYLDALSTRLQGTPVTVETADGRADDVEFPERGLPLVGITYDEKDGGGSVNIILGDSTRDHITHTVTRPVHLYHKEGAGLISDEINAGEVLEITSQDAPPITFLRFGGEA